MLARELEASQRDSLLPDRPEVHFAWKRPTQRILSTKTFTKSTTGTLLLVHIYIQKITTDRVQEMCQITYYQQDVVSEVPQQMSRNPKKLVSDL